MRRLVHFALLLGLFPLIPSPDARATQGSYSITVCGGGANRAWLPSATPGMYAGPAPHACSGGLTVRHEIGGDTAKVPGGAVARFGMLAPAGTTIGLATVSGRFDTRGKNWQAVLSDGSKVLLGCPRGRESCAERYDDQLVVLNASKALYIETLCTKGPCLAGRHPDADSDHAYARARVGSVGMTINDPTPPEIANAGGSAWTSAWIGGKRVVTFDARDGSGIVGAFAQLDGRTVAQSTRRCGSYVLRCRDFIGVPLDVDLTRLSDGQHTLTVVARDRASNPASLPLAINVDNNAPTPPTGLASDVSHGWTASPAVRLNWTNPAQQFAPIAGATVQSCPVGAPGSCTTRFYGGADLAAVDYELPGEGVWDISVWLHDAAGNATPGQASSPIRIGLDRQAPSEVVFRRFDRDNPSIVHVHAIDTLSGIAGGRVEIRRRGRKAWRGMRTRVVADGLVAQIPDGRLRNGKYLLRARVVDVAGNERSTRRSVTGRTAKVRLPVRVAAKMRVGRAKKVRARKSSGRRRAKTVYVRKPVIRHGRRVVVGGRLLAPGRNPLAGVPVEVSARSEKPDAHYRPVARLRTSKRGRFAYSLPPGKSRFVRFVYRGAPKIRPQERTVHVRVRAATSISVSRDHVVNGEAVKFTGKIKTGPQPETGKLVELQYYDRGKWRTFRSVHASPKDGSWAFEYRFTGTSGVRKYKFRARLPRESGYGYAVGASRGVKVTVRGL